MPKLHDYYPKRFLARFTNEQWDEIVAYKESKGITTIAGAVRQLVAEGLERERRRAARK